MEQKMIELELRVAKNILFEMGKIRPKDAGFMEREYLRTAITKAERLRIVTCGGCFLKMRTSHTKNELYHGALSCTRCESTDFDEEVK